MLVSNYFGLGILGAVSHRVLMNILDEEENKINRGANLFRIPLFGVFNIEFNINQIQQPLQTNQQIKLQKLVDNTAVLLQFGNSFNQPFISWVFAAGHIFLKLLRLQALSRNDFRQNKINDLKFIFKAKCIFVGISALFLVFNPFSTKIDPVFIKK